MSCAAQTFYTASPSPSSQHHHTHTSPLKFLDPLFTKRQQIHERVRLASQHVRALPSFPFYPSRRQPGSYSVSVWSQYPPRSTSTFTNVSGPPRPVNPNDFETCFRSIRRPASHAPFLQLFRALWSVTGDLVMLDHPGLKITDQRLESSLPESST